MRKRTSLVAVGGVLGVALVAVGALGAVRDDSNPVPARPVVAAAFAARSAGGELGSSVVSLEARVAAVPKDQAAWATLALAYVQQAKATTDPSLYARAEAAIATSREIGGADNFLADAAASALASARHEFETAEGFARDGLTINPYDPLLYGALSDALLQLGRYDEAFDAVQRMVDLRPDTTSLARASYTWELRGDAARATELMQRALDDAPTPATRAFAAAHLGELAFDQGDANLALGHYLDALAGNPDDPAALAGRAKAEAAIGQIETALEHYELVTTRFPEPAYVLEYAELLESVGRTDAAQVQYSVFEATQQLFAEAGVRPDATAVLYEAERGDPATAVAHGLEAVAERPFMAAKDALAWALYQAGTFDEALAASNEARALGTRSALFDYHAGMIALARGDIEAARADLASALETNPNFNPIAAPIAAATLAELGAP